jgi:oligosaccharide repeat unit polymerase
MADRSQGRLGMTANSQAVLSTTGTRMGVSSLIILFGLVVTYFFLPPGDAVDIFTTAAVGVGLSLTVSTLIEGSAGVRSLIRVDVLMLWVLYSLTFLEFLFPQLGINDVVSPDAATSGTTAALIGFAGLAVGRNLLPRRSGQSVSIITLTPRGIFYLFLTAALLGYFHVLVAVNFDLLEMMRQMSLPRFAQAWSRGQYGGDLFSLLVEIGALIYLVPPTAGLIYAHGREYSSAQRWFVTSVLALTFYYAIASGTRSTVAIYVFTFFGAYYFNKDHIKSSQLIVQGSLVAVGLLVVTAYMLQYRNIGLSQFSLSDVGPATLYIDQNMVVISTLTTVFPNLHDYLGLEIPYQALIHPIPRALWSGKPEGLSVTIESIMQTTQATMASSFVGEAYMSGGMIGVLLAGVGFGTAAELWNRVGRNVHSSFSQLLYASGFFCAAISMRSILWMTVAMLPTLALWLYGKLLLSRSR